MTYVQHEADPHGDDKTCLAFIPPCSVRCIWLKYTMCQFRFIWNFRLHITLTNQSLSIHVAIFENVLPWNVLACSIQKYKPRHGGPVKLWSTSTKQQLANKFRENPLKFPLWTTLLTSNFRLTLIYTFILTVSDNNSHDLY